YIGFSLPLEGADAPPSAPVSEPLRPAGAAAPGARAEPYALVDPKRMREVQSMLGPAWQELLQAFFEDAAVQIELLQDAWRAVDRAALKRHAHALKGASGSIGASGFSALCLELEKGSTQLPEDQLSVLVSAVCTRYADLPELLAAVPA
ncbi:MAG: Hpt domain-containing protein, partial [Rhodocyclaceae bacterium]|nr:Hpt domain-containing protein [Rhodocyclaceae bacterium]